MASVELEKYPPSCLHCERNGRMMLWQESHPLAKWNKGHFEPCLTKSSCVLSIYLFIFLIETCFLELVFSTINHHVKILKTRYCNVSPLTANCAHDVVATLNQRQ